MKIKTTIIIASTILSVAFPALAAGPYHLDSAGKDVMVPTWAFKSTKLCVKSNDPNNYGTVKINAGLAAEDLGTTGGGTSCIDRNWGGIGVTVTNIRNDMRVPVDIWTE